jgi:hypothetical protein
MKTKKSMKNVVEQNKHFTKIYSQCGYITVCNSKMGEKNILDRSFAQLSIEDTDGSDMYYINLTDEAIDALIKALKNAKT